MQYISNWLFAVGVFSLLGSCRGYRVFDVEHTTVVYSFKKICIDTGFCRYFPGNRDIFVKGERFDLLNSETELLSGPHPPCQSADPIYTSPCFSDTVSPSGGQQRIRLKGYVYSKKNENDYLYVVFNFSGNVSKLRRLTDVEMFYLNRNLSKCMDTPRPMANPFYMICNIETCGKADETWLKKHGFIQTQIDSFQVMPCH